MAVTDKDKAKAICTTFDFSKLDDVKTFLAATYYGGTYLDTLKTKTSMTDDEIAKLFDASDPKSFQSAYLLQLSTIKTQFTCVSEKDRCSDDELAQLQWGSSLLTSNIYTKYQSSQYL